MLNYTMSCVVFSPPHIMCSLLAPLVFTNSTIGVRHHNNGKRWWNRV
ncbi:hypothetical protein HMPREF9148_01343 [Prevotella sp. F0091]|nr:hypothetical protein HMPREF9148_01343 [Prevotella sp. F0091]